MKTYKIDPFAMTEIADAMRLWITTRDMSYLSVVNDEIVCVDNLTGEIPVTDLYRDIPNQFFAALAAVEELTPEVAQYWAIEKVIMSITPDSVTI